MGRIVVGVDGSEAASDALRWAVEEARLREDEVKVVFAYVAAMAGREEMGFPEHPSSEKELEDAAYEALDRILVDVAGASDVPVTGRIERGPAARVLIDAARGADLLVVGSRGVGGFRGLLLGSVSQQVVTHAPCPVVVVRHSEPPER